MALPTSRNTTYAAGSQVKSADLNDIQDKIIDNNTRLNNGAGAPVTLASLLTANAGVATTNVVASGTATATAPLKTSAGFHRIIPGGTGHDLISGSRDWFTDESGSAITSQASPNGLGIPLIAQAGERIVSASISLQYAGTPSGTRTVKLWRTNVTTGSSTQITSVTIPAVTGPQTFDLGITNHDIDTSVYVYGFSVILGTNSSGSITIFCIDAIMRQL